MQLKMGNHINDTIAEKYHQQFLKLATAEIAERLELSENYVIWDSDMLLLRDFCPFNSKGRINFMEGPARPDTPREKTILDVCHANAGKSFTHLTGLNYANAWRKNGVGYTPRHMVVNRQSMADLLNAIHTRSAKANSHWSTAILEAACPTLQACVCGFSEHGSYASWMKTTSPSLVAEVTRQEGPSAFPSHKSPCCPYEYSFATETKQGLLAAEFPQSSSATCKANSLLQVDEKVFHDGHEGAHSEVVAKTSGAAVVATPSVAPPLLSTKRIAPTKQ